MATTLTDDPVLVRFRRALDEMVRRNPPRPRGAVWLARAAMHAPTELDRLARLRVKMIDETGGFFDGKPYPAAALREHTPLMHEIRQDGLDL